MAPTTIRNSVGRGGQNEREDIVFVQGLLKKCLSSALEVSGTCDASTVAVIEGFQKGFMASPDGRIDPNGETIRRLLALDSGFVILPQVSGTGYYSYSPAERQFGTATVISTVVSVCKSFISSNPGVLIGIGDISFQDGSPMPPHSSHKRGRDIDNRPLRKDGARSPVTIQDPNYSRDRTKSAIDLYFASGNVDKILFNDTSIAGVTPFAGHDNHFHVHLKE